MLDQLPQILAVELALFAVLLIPAGLFGGFLRWLFGPLKGLLSCLFVSLVVGGGWSFVTVPNQAPHYYLENLILFSPPLILASILGWGIAGAFVAGKGGVKKNS